MNHFTQYPRIAVSELSKLTLDKVSERRFDKRFQLGLLGGMLLGCGPAMVGGLLYYHGILTANQGGAIIFAGVIPGVAITFITHRRMLRAIPLSIKSDNQMFPFVLENREQVDSIEIAYIDQSSGTYFTKLYAI